MLSVPSGTSERDPRSRERDSHVANIGTAGALEPASAVSSPFRVRGVKMAVLIFQSSNRT